MWMGRVDTWHTLLDENLSFFGSYFYFCFYIKIHYLIINSNLMNADEFEKKNQAIVYSMMPHKCRTATLIPFTTTFHSPIFFLPTSKYGQSILRGVP